MASVRKAAWPAEYTFDIATFRLASPWHSLHVESGIIGHKYVELAIAIIVHERASGPEAGMRIQEAGFLSDVGKRAIPVVAIKRVLAPAGDEQIFEAVVVIVSDGDSICIPCPEQTSLRGYIGEGAVAIIFVETIRGRRGRVVESRTRENQNVYPAVIVIIEKSRPTTHRLYDVVRMIRMTADNHLFESGLTGDVGQACVKGQPGRLTAGQRLHAAGGHSWTRRWLLSFERCRGQGEQTEEATAGQETNLTWEIEAQYVLFYFAGEKCGGGASRRRVRYDIRSRFSRRQKIIFKPSST